MWRDQAKWVWTENNKTQVSFSLHASISELYYAENPIKIEHTVPEIAIYSDA